MSFCLGSSLLPVTSLEFVSAARDEFLIAGEGPTLKAFSQDGQLLCRVEALPFRVIHGIKALQHGVSVLLLVFGQKAFRVVELLTGKELRLVPVCGMVELSDWLLDMGWLHWEDPGNYSVAAVTAHNVFSVHQVIPQRYSALIVGSSLDNLLIMSGTVFNKILLWCVQDRPMATQSPMAAQSQVVRVSYEGHQGVIFSLKLNDELSKLISASDDRTVRIWNIPEDWRSRERSVESSCLLVLYGHTARVWLARLLPQGIISVGEDAVCRVWSHEGKILTTFRGHKGKSVWSMAVNKEHTTLATGGGDCSIRVYSLEKLSCRPEFHSWEHSPCSGEGPRQTPPPDLPRCVFLLGQTVLCLSERGSLIAGRAWTATMEAVWSQVHHDPEFSAYSVGAISPHGSRILALGNIRGAVKLLKLDESGRVLESVSIAAYCGKVFSLTWALSRSDGEGRELIFSCGPDGSIVCWDIRQAPLEAVKLASWTLPVSKHRWLTTVSILPRSDSCPSSPPSSLPSPSSSSVLCGDRKGSLHLYHWSHNPQENCTPCQTLQGLHGPNGVTHTCLHQSFIYSCGRNGLCRKFKLDREGRLVELTTFKPVKGLDWIEKVYFTSDDMLVLGFHGANLVVHSTVQNRRLLDVACGGGHRSYAIDSLEEICARKSAQVVFIKQAEICYGDVELEDYCSNSLLQQAFVGLEAVSMVVLSRDYESGQGLVAVGSEDCTVCLLRLHPSASDGATALHITHTLQGHASSVRALSTSDSASHSARHLLFSGGARASVKVWSIGEDNMEEAYLETGLFLCDNQKRKKRSYKRPFGSDVLPECRAMALTSFPLHTVYSCCFEEDRLRPLHYVAAGCSDALIRQYIYNEKDKVFSQLQSLQSSENCVLCLKHFFHNSILPSAALIASDQGNGEALPISRYPVLCSTSTDGHIAVWSVQPFLSDWMCHLLVSPPHPTTEQPPAPPVSRFRVHQSGINDLAVRSKPVGDAEDVSVHAVVSVGDDNALALTCLSVATGSCGVSITQSNSHSHLNAHASPITGVCYVGEDMVMTTSSDQRLNVWRVSLERGMELVSSHMHNVADPSSLTAYNTKQDGTVVIICGVGLQQYTYECTLN